MTGTTNTYVFTVGIHNEQAHDYTSALIAQAYERKNAGTATSAQERIDKADEIVELYWLQVGQIPPSAVLSRLAWYIVFDAMTDDHPDKITREEYPILSQDQLDRRYERDVCRAEIEYSGREFNGRVRRHFVDDGDAMQVTSPRVASNTAAPFEDIVDWTQTFADARLTVDESTAIKMTYWDNATQTEVARKLGVSQQRVSYIVSRALSKLRNCIV